MTPAPELSIVLPTDTYDTVRYVLGHLRRQNAHELLEVVLVAPSSADLNLEDDARAGFADVRVVEWDGIRDLPTARARGVHAASAPVVVLAETHSYPQPGWAAALIEAHRGPWSAVGPAIENANPGTMRSWVNIFMDYGPWVQARKPGATDKLPGHNSSFKRDVLVAYGDELADKLRHEGELLEDLLASGHQFYLEPAARTAHLNVTRMRSWAVERFTAGRVFAALRRRRWPRRRRLLYLVGSTLIPFVRLGRMMRQIRRAGSTSILPGVLPVLALGLLISAAGELCGYAFGAGDAERGLYEMELHRVRHVIASDLRDQDAAAVPG